MHDYVQSVIATLSPARSDGPGGYLRIKPGADSDRV